MTLNERRARIVATLRACGPLTLARLAGALGDSCFSGQDREARKDTLRRVLRRMAAEGEIELRGLAWRLRPAAPSSPSSLETRT